MKETKQVKAHSQTGHIVLTVIGIVLCIILLPILAVNVTLIVKGTIRDDIPPDIAGVTPLVVLSGSMDDGSEDAIKIGDLIFVKKVDADSLKVGDIIAFMEGDYAVTHRITGVNNDNGTKSFTTKGDANNTEDTSPVTSNNILGKYDSRISKLGNFVIFLQTVPGIVLFVGVPLLVFIGYDIIRRQALLKNERIKQDQLRKEIEELKNNPTSAELPREVLKKPQEEAPASSPWEYPREELKAESERLSAIDPEEKFTIPLPQVEPEPIPQPESIPEPVIQPKAEPAPKPVVEAPRTTQTVVSKPKPQQRTTTTVVRKTTVKKNKSSKVMTIKVKTK